MVRQPIPPRVSSPKVRSKKMKGKVFNSDTKIYPEKFVDIKAR